MPAPGPPQPPPPRLVPVARYLGLMVLLLPVLAVGKCGADVIRHNRALDGFAATLFEHPPPPEASLLDRHRELGLLVGNGNHCDLRAWIDLQTTKAVEDVAAHYAGIDGGAAPRLTVSRQAAGVVRVEIFEWAGANPVGWDWRCG